MHFSPPSLPRRGRGGGCFATFNRSRDRREDVIDIIDDVQVGEAQDLDPEGIQVGRPLAIVLHGVAGQMGIAVHFDRKLHMRCVEIEDVGIDTILRAKPCPQLPASKALPEPLLSLSRCLPQRSALIALARLVEM